MVNLASVFLSTDTVILCVGIVGLYLGAELLVDSAASLALDYGMRATTVGVTIVAFATTAPELIVSTIGGLTESDAIALGNIVGSNIANIGLVLGMSAAVFPMTVERTLVRKHGPFMLLAVVGLVGLGYWDRTLGRVDGVVLLGMLAVYTGFILHRARAGSGDVIPDEFELEEDEDATATPLDFVKIVGAGLFLLVGSRSLITGGQGLLSQLGFGDLFIGLTIIAFGTSMPELATSLVSAHRRGSAFSVGNVIGSNIYNVLAVIGVVALLVPIQVSPSTLSVEFPMLVVFTLVVLGLLSVRDRVSRVEGVALLTGYAGFIYVLLVTSG